MTNIFIDKRSGEKVSVDDETATKYLKNPAIFTVVEGDTDAPAEEVKEEATEEVVEEVIEETPIEETEDVAPEEATEETK